MVPHVAFGMFEPNSPDIKICIAKRLLCMQFYITVLFFPTRKSKVTCKKTTKSTLTMNTILSFLKTTEVKKLKVHN